MYILCSTSADIHAFKTLFTCAAQTMTNGLYAGPIMCYKLLTNSAKITCQKAREQGKESTKPKWDTDMVWIAAWDIKLRLKKKNVKLHL